ncbi:hypothetical protein [Moorena producens]|uniref:hypothetical protein n=1 Tax=Moorena producens TaxID=1155739 RepID=UPI003C77268B
MEILILNFQKNRSVTSQELRPSAVSSQQSAVSGQRSAVSGQRSAVSGQRSAVSRSRCVTGRAVPTTKSLNIRTHPPLTHPTHSLFPIPYSLFPIPYSLFPIPYSLFPIPFYIFTHQGIINDYLLNMWL